MTDVKDRKDQPTGLTIDEDGGPPNAENKGVWRILRNSTVLAILLMLGILFVALW